jgi:hypothetical protein
MVLVKQFHWRLRKDVKDLFFTMLDVSTLAEEISQVVKCKNRLFERHHNKGFGFLSSFLTMPSNSIINNHESMQIDSMRF